MSFYNTSFSYSAPRYVHENVETCDSLMRDLFIRAPIHRCTSAEKYYFAVRQMEFLHLHVALENQYRCLSNSRRVVAISLVLSSDRSNALA